MIDNFATFHSVHLKIYICSTSLRYFSLIYKTLSVKFRINIMAGTAKSIIFAIQSINSVWPRITAILYLLPQLGLAFVRYESIISMFKSDSTVIQELGI